MHLKEPSFLSRQWGDSQFASGKVLVDVTLEMF